VKKFRNPDALIVVKITYKDIKLVGAAFRNSTPQLGLLRNSKNPAFQ